MILGEWTLSGSSWASPPFRRRTGAFTLQAQILPGLQAACSKAIAGQTEHGFVGLWGRPGRIGQSERAFPVLRETMISKRPVRLPSNPSTQPTRPSIHPSTIARTPSSLLPSLLPFAAACRLAAASLAPFVALQTGTQTRTHKDTSPRPRDPALCQTGHQSDGDCRCHPIAKSNKPQRYPYIQPTVKNYSLHPTQI